jgi:hypothetical protein
MVTLTFRKRRQRKEAELCC